MSASNTPAKQFNTSVLGNVDRRYGDDFPLGQPLAVTNFADQLDRPTFPGGTAQRFVATSSFSGISWSSLSDETILTSPDVQRSTFSSGGNIFTMVTTTTPLTAYLFTTVESLYTFLVFYHDGSTGQLLAFDGGPNNVTIDASNLYIGADIIVLPGINRLYYLKILDNGAAYLTDMMTGETQGTPLSIPAIAPTTNISVGGYGFTGGLLELFNYEILPDLETIDEYITRKYAGFEMPLTFPENSSVPTNS